jgi:hypothetical protein
MSSPGPVDHTLVCIECGTLGTAAAERGWRGLRSDDFSGTQSKRGTTAMNLSFLKSNRQSETAAPSDTDSDSLVVQIRRLGELRDSGLISAEQFRLRRAQLVGRSI